MKPLCTPLLLIIVGALLSFESNASNAFPKPLPLGLDIVFEGDYFTLYTSGARLKKGRHLKSSVWNVPSRKVKEMWIQRKGMKEVIRLDPYRFQKQLVKLLPNYPEVHGFIKHSSFQYGDLESTIPELDQHLQRVKEIREDKHQIIELDSEILNK